ncbi:MAG: tyrosine-type recombinase/integrase [Thermoplasmatota archaeon]
MPTNDFEGRIKKAKSNLNDRDDIIKENKEKLLEFDKQLELNDYSKARRYKYLVQLPKIVSQLDKPLEEAKREDIENLILWLKRREDINSTTKNDYKKLLKRFYKWIGDGEYPPCVEWLKINYNNSNGKLPEEMLTEDDIEELIDHALNPRDKALISILWETGARIGELIDLTVGSIEDRQHGLKIVVDGKTGSRRIPLIESVPYINKWLEEHPDRDNKEAPLWVNIGEVNLGEKMNYPAIRKLLKKARDRSDIDKPVNPHNFRHSRATYLANRFTEAQLCEWFGWVQGSDVPSKYVHLSGRDIDQSYDRLHGIVTEENKEESKLTPKECPRCNEKNPPKAKYCNRCGMALSLEASQDIEERSNELSKGFMELAKENPELMEVLEEEIKKAKIKKAKEDLE